MTLPSFNLSGGLLLSALVLVYVFQRLRRKSLKNLRGPSAESWLVGNLREITHTLHVGEVDSAWTRDYGGALRIKGAFGSDILFTADPKSLQYVLNTSGYNYPKPPEARAIINLRAGNGIAWAEGPQHARQKKMMIPAFSYNSLKLFLPLFQHTAQRTIVKWRDVITNSGKSSQVLDIPMWLSRTTLDALGATAFDYDFGALNEETDNELSAAYDHLSAGSYCEQSDNSIAMDALPGLLPAWMSAAMQLIPSKRTAIFRNYMKVARSVAKGLIDRQQLDQEGGKDVMSVLVKANLAEKPNNRLSEQEILSQLTTLMIAGHESIAATLEWALYELSRHPEFQNEVREEIKATRLECERRGANDITIADLDSMKLLGALIKETLRFHAIVPRLERVAARDDVIPLSTPVVSRTGEEISAIPISKGQRVFLAFAAYNRLKSVWGEDADTWRPKRFLEGVEKNQQVNVGVMANLATFSSGVRGCIGWRFGMIELQVMLMEFIENFEFSPPPGNIEIQRVATNMMTPMIKGSKTGDIELPLTVRSLV